MDVENHPQSRTAIRRKRAAIFFAALALLGLMMKLFGPAGSVVSDLGLIFLVAWFPVLTHFQGYYASKVKPMEEAPPESGATSVFEWLAANRAAISALLFIVSGGALLVALHFAPVAHSEIIHRTIYQVEYVGPLEKRAGWRLSSTGAADVGYGIGWYEGSSQGPESYLLFSKVLELEEEDVRRIRDAGSPYRVGIHERRIVTITGDKGTGVSYEEYVARATRQRNNWLVLAVTLLVLAAGCRLVRAHETV